MDFQASLTPFADGYFAAVAAASAVAPELPERLIGLIALAVLIDPDGAKTINIPRVRHAIAAALDAIAQPLLPEAIPTND